MPIHSQVNRPWVYSTDTSIPVLSYHVDPTANENFTHGKSPFVRPVNGLSDPNQNLIASRQPIMLDATSRLPLTEHFDDAPFIVMEVDTSVIIILVFSRNISTTAHV